MKNLKIWVVAGWLIAGLGRTSPAQMATPPAPVATEAVTLPDKTVTDMLTLLMGALQDDNYTAFMAPMDESVKAALPKPAFEQVVQAMGPRITAGYKTNFLDSVKHQGVSTYLWRVKFSDKGDDMIALLTIKDDKAAAFLLM